jgi:hypothetical protein
LLPATPRGIDSIPQPGRLFLKVARGFFYHVLISITASSNRPVKVAARFADIKIKIGECDMAFLLKRASAMIVLFTLWLVISELW